MRDFDEVLAASVAARDESLDGMQPTADARARTWRGVRRRRTRRHAFEGVAAVGVVAVIGTLGWAGAHRGTVEPAPPVPTASSSPTPSSTPTPTPSGTPSPSGTPDATGLLPLPAGLLETTTEPGWMLTLYDASEDSPAGTLVLTSLDGARYRVMDLPSGGDLRLLSWAAGSSEVVVSRPGADGFTRGIMNLATGKVTEQDGGLKAPAAYLGIDFNGNALWVEYDDVGDGGGTGTVVAVDGVHPGPSVPYGWGSLQLNASRTRAVTGSGTPLEQAFRSVDLVTGNATDVPYGVDGQECQVVSWYDDDNVLAACRDTNDADQAGEWTWGENPGHPALYTVAAAGGSSPSKISDLDPDGPLPVAASGVPMSEGVVALAAQLRSDPQCPAAYTWKGGDFTKLDTPHGWVQMLGEAGTVYVSARDRCEGDDEVVAPVSPTGVGSNLLGAAPEPGSVASSWVIGSGPSSG